MNSERFELLVGHRAMLDKRIYFLMASSGTCIGFALTQTKDLHLHCMHLTIGAALCLWALSFWFGHRSIDALTCIAGYNVDLLEAWDSEARGAAYYPTPEALRRLIDGKNAELEKFQNLQVKTLLLGVLAFVIWQIMLMIQRST